MRSPAQKPTTPFAYDPQNLYLKVQISRCQFSLSRSVTCQGVFYFTNSVIKTTNITCWSINLNCLHILPSTYFAFYIFFLLHILPSTYFAFYIFCLLHILPHGPLSSFSSIGTATLVGFGLLNYR